MGEIKEPSFRFRTQDGVDLFVHAWPVDSPKAVVQISHGMAEHAARYARLAGKLNDAGISVYANDHRGHGRSIPPGGVPGHFADSDGWNRAVADLHGINRRIAQENAGLPIVLLGHSMGSFILQQLMIEHPTDMVAAILSGSNGKPPLLAKAGRVLARVERRRLGPSKVSDVIQKLSFEGFNNAFEPVRTDSDWLSRDPAEVDAYIDDPLCGFPVTVQTWVDMLDALDRVADPRLIRRVPREMPLYIYSGSEDPVGERGDGVERLVDAYRSAGVKDITFTLYPGGRHEMLNEVNRDEVERDLVAFVERVTAGRARTLGA